MRGSLFSLEFLIRGIRDAEVWNAVSESDALAFADQVKQLFDRVRRASPNEADTETLLARPIWEALGWPAFLREQQADTIGRSDVPDVMLFARDGEQARALELPAGHERWRLATTFVELKRWKRPLDKRHGKEEAPSSQAVWYLRRTSSVTEGRIQAGVLTDGQVWRLYLTEARSISRDFLEFDLLSLVEPQAHPPSAGIDEPVDPTHALRVFLHLFRPQAFFAGADGTSFHHRALQGSRLWEEKVSADLGRVVFDEIFPLLVREIGGRDPSRPAGENAAWREDLRRAALTFLYRLLFLFYAEDRDLLPVRDKRYDDYSFRSVRQEVARRTDGGDTFSEVQPRLWGRIAALTEALEAGDPSIGLPAYDGGLFRPGATPILDRIRLPDAVIARVVDALGRREHGGQRRWINFRELAVQHLGTIYERLLEHEVVLDGEGRLDVRLHPYARKGSGSYFTPEPLVDLILDHAVEPLVARARDAPDPASRLLDLKVCDPAMGSGHFLVSVVDRIADRAIEAMAAAPSALGDRLDDMRAQIESAAAASGWTVPTEHLDDRHLVRRLVVKRVVFGVDKNPMAVELAKVALWLHTFTVGAPLSFLDHHLRCGDSLFGEGLRGALDRLARAGSLLARDVVATLTDASAVLQRIADVADLSIEEVEESQQLFSQAEQEIRPVQNLLDFVQATRWLDAEGKSVRAAQAILDGLVGDPWIVLAQGRSTNEDARPQIRMEADELLAACGALTRRERFHHWEVAFPEVWTIGEDVRSTGGFDAVIGNPPWDRTKLQEVEWLALRRPEIARMARASDRADAVARLQAAGDPLHLEFLDAAARADACREVARDCGAYPLLSGGDTNLYSLFVERASNLVAPEGQVAQLVPSGIAADKGASEFLRALTGASRLSAILDFQNRDFFPDVDSRFKFCVFGFSGAAAASRNIRCACFLTDVTQVQDPDRCFDLTPEDFRRVNPNTGTAPVFRTRRDAAVVTAIYARHPVLVDRSAGAARSIYPVRYWAMFHMTNDARRFRTAAELDGLGAYPVAERRWRRGTEEWLPLYVGRMVHPFDHRSGGVRLNPENVHNPYVTVEASDAEKTNPGWWPEPQHWVAAADVEWPPEIDWLIGFRDIARADDARTVIATVVPRAAVGNKLPLLVPATGLADAYRRFAPLLLTNLNSFAFDYVARQKLHGTSLNWYIVEQLPVLPPETWERNIGGRPVGDFVRGEVLRLCYTATDLAGFARDLGWPGEPFPWDAEDRLHRRARLDAIVFHLYGLTRPDVEWVMDAFPIIRRHDVSRYGRFRTRELVLAYLRAVEAGDLESQVAH